MTQTKNIEFKIYSKSKVKTRKQVIEFANKEEENLLFPNSKEKGMPNSESQIHKFNEAYSEFRYVKIEEIGGMYLVNFDGIVTSMPLHAPYLKIAKDVFPKALSITLERKEPGSKSFAEYQVIVDLSN